MPQNSDPIVSFVVAMADNGIIGRDGGLPWHVSSDLKFFRKVTLGKPVLMGRKTFQSIGRPLDKRENIVITRNRDFSATGIHVALDLEAGLALGRELALKAGVDEIAVIGGAQIYHAALPYAGRIYLTRIHTTPEGDASFPDLNPAIWREVSREAHEPGPKDDHAYSIIVLERRTA